MGTWPQLTSEAPSLRVRRDCEIRCEALPLATLRANQRQTRKSDPAITDTKPWTEDKATAKLVLDDGSVDLGHRHRRRRQGGWRNLLQHRDYRLSGNPDRPELCRPDHHIHVPHIGNVGANPEDTETSNLASRSGVRGCVMRADITEPSNYRAAEHLDQWLKARGIIAITGIDTRALTARIREKGMPNGVIAHEPTGTFDIEALKKEAKAWPGLVGMDLVPDVTSGQSYTWDEMRWVWDNGYPRNENPEFHVVAIDYGLKRNILRCLANAGCKITVRARDREGGRRAGTQSRRRFPLQRSGRSGGDGQIRGARDQETRCQRQAAVRHLPRPSDARHRAWGQDKKMHQGHHGANHPVKDFTTNKVEIMSMNHGFAVDRDSLPKGVVETHVSLFDGSNCGLALEGKPVFSVQHHPEASPGPQDSHYLFTRFANYMRTANGGKPLRER